MSANKMIYVVYPYAEGRYNAVKVHARAGTTDIHAAIARFENNETQSRRRWKEPIQPGSFNIAKITDAHSRADAIQQARAQGLKYEPKPVVLKRYREELGAAGKAFRDIGRRGGQQGTDNRTVLDDIFGDFLKRGPTR